MQIINELVIRIVAISILSCLLEYILPQGTLKRSAMRVIGLIMLINIAEPIIQALGM
ncbi:MAG: hypothetical protein RR232_01935 [Clostridia bacterium]